MSTNVLKRIGSLVTRQFRQTPKGSVRVHDEAAVERFCAEPDNPFLISFPRTGSHWLRMMMELCFERPSLVRVFYYPDKDNYLTLHTHDLKLDVERRRVIYLYREPVATVYSQLRYEREDIDDRAIIGYWSDLYGRHLHKWLCTETCTSQKTILTYEGIQADLAGELRKVANMLELPLEPSQVESAASRVTPREVNHKTVHDPRVVPKSRRYSITRQRFCRTYGREIQDLILRGRPELEDLLALRRSSPGDV